jgi:hypothetical protein
MIFACRTPHTPAMLFSRTDGLDMKVSTRQKQGATRHNRGGAKGDNSASSAPEGPREGPLLRLTRLEPLTETGLDALRPGARHKGTSGDSSLEGAGLRPAPRLSRRPAR